MDRDHRPARFSKIGGGGMGVVYKAEDQVFVIGGSAAAILMSLEPRVKRVVANCSLVDWSILDTAEKAETANYAEYIRQAFGNAYRLSDANWNKLRSRTFYNPWHTGRKSRVPRC
jgi:hypothetical protein